MHCDDVRELIREEAHRRHGSDDAGWCAFVSDMQKRIARRLFEQALADYDQEQTGKTPPATSEESGIAGSKSRG